MIEDESVKNLRKSIFEKAIGKYGLVGTYGLDYKIVGKSLLDWIHEEYNYRQENNLTDSIGRD